jgi:hypothetical protein
MGNFSNFKTFKSNYSLDVGKGKILPHPQASNFFMDTIERTLRQSTLSDFYLAIKPFKYLKSKANAIEFICDFNNNYICTRFKSIHEGQELGNNPHFTTTKSSISVGQKPSLSLKKLSLNPVSIGQKEAIATRRKKDLNPIVGPMLISVYWG